MPESFVLCIFLYASMRNESKQLNKLLIPFRFVLSYRANVLLGEDQVSPVQNAFSSNTMIVTRGFGAP